MCVLKILFKLFVYFDSGSIRWLTSLVWCSLYLWQFITVSFNISLLLLIYIYMYETRAWSHGHVTSTHLCLQDDDNIPMRIMLLLLDEVFDLRKKNQWLRRRIVAILRQIIKATYGDRINRWISCHQKFTHK